MKTSYRERDHICGNALLQLRTAIGLTQGRLGNFLGVSGRAVGEWETGGSYPKSEHLKKLIALALQHQAFTPGNEAEEIRLLWKMTRQKMFLEESWLSGLLSEGASSHMAKASVEETKNLVAVAARPLSEPEGGHAGRETETPALFQANDQDTPVIQNLPFPPNPFFTGRESKLLQIAEHFEQSARVAITQPIGISGLGGIGKTQLALAYAHRYHPSIYRCVFWVDAADKATLEAGYLALAGLLKLPEEKEREVDRIVQAVKNWLEQHSHWLLILDNADDLELARCYLPTKPRGHILLTTRSQIVGALATLIRLEPFSPQAGLLFFLRRSGVLPSGSEPESIAADIRQAAGELVELLAGHPLALDQAGAYIEETSDPEVGATSASFTEYKEFYQEQRHLLLKRRGALGNEYPDSVALTFEISVQKACQLHPQCAEVLAFCSLLHSDAIPEELLHQSLSLDALPFNEVIRALRSYSLIKRNAEMRVLSLHRLVQAVIRDGMDWRTWSRWAERVAQVLNEVFPKAPFEEWKRCERYLPHVLVYAKYEAAPPLQVSYLLTKAGTYLQERGQYADAEPLLMRALSLCQQHLGSEHLDAAKSLNNLALLYWHQKKYEQAESLLVRALSLREQHLEAEHLDTAKSLNDLALLYRDQGKYEQAEALFQRAIDTTQAVNYLPNNDDTTLTSIPRDPTEATTLSRNKWKPISKPTLGLVIAALLVFALYAQIIVSPLQGNNIKPEIVSGRVLCANNKQVEGIWASAVSGGKVAQDISEYAGFRPTNSNGSEVAFSFELRSDGYDLHVGCGGTRVLWEDKDNTEDGTGTVHDSGYHFFTCHEVPHSVEYGACDLKY